jgi:hypothetical protein
MFKNIVTVLLTITTIFLGLTVIFLTRNTKQDTTQAVFLQSQILKVLETGSKLSTVINGGVDYRRFSSLVADFHGEVDMFISMAPDNFAEPELAKLREAGAAWNFAKELWGTNLENRQARHTSRVIDSYNMMSEDFKNRVQVHDSIYIRYADLPVCFAYASDLFEDARHSLLTYLR